MMERGKQKINDGEGIQRISETQLMPGEQRRAEDKTIAQQKGSAITGCFAGHNWQAVQCCYEASSVSSASSAVQYIQRCSA
jgi:hypothetical protein